MTKPITRYRSIFISDLHLGSAGCRVDAILNFLDRFECDHLYLVGDIVDGWVGKSEGKWGRGSTEAIRMLLEKSNHTNTRVFYTPGNHDAFLRRLNGAELGNILIDHSFVHTTATGRELLVVHGDLFDRSCTKFLPVAWVGAWLYEWITVVNAHVNRTRARRERKPVDFAGILKLAVKRLVKRGDSFETQLVEHAIENGCDGVVCGHVHRPALRERADGRLYVNTGDWVQHCTAVVETTEGQLQLLYWKDLFEEDASRPSDGGRRPLALPQR